VFIPVPPGATPGLDHADGYHDAITGTTRLYVAHTRDDRIDVIEWTTNSYLRALPDVPGVSGVLTDSAAAVFLGPRLCAHQRASLRCMT
jgi:hypothetical protein